MNDELHDAEEIRPGDAASVENRGPGGLAVCIMTADGSRVELELGSGQAVQVTAGESVCRVSVLEGKAEDLLVVKPDTP